MNDNILRALMQLSAFVAQINQTHFHTNAHSLIKTYLEQTTGRHNFRMHIKEYLAFYKEYNNINNSHTDSLHINKEKLCEICTLLTTQLTINERFILFLSFLELINLDKIVTPEEEVFLKIIAFELKIYEQEYAKAFDFIINPHPTKVLNKNYIVISDSEAELAEELEGSWILKNKPGKISYHRFNQKNLKGKIYILKFEQTDIIVLKYLGNDEVYLSKNLINQDKFYVLNQHDYIVINNSHPIHYYQINNIYKNENITNKLVLSGKNVLIAQPKGNKYDPEPFSFSEDSGNIICIYGKDDFTESVLRNISGKDNLKKGKIEINGFNLHKEIYRLQKFTGYIYNEPLFSEDLTVFENLYYIVKLTYPNLDEKKIHGLINEILHTCQITEIKYQSYSKSDRIKQETLYIRLIQLACELIKDPYILFVNNIFNNLSISDSALIFKILRSFTTKGKVVFICTDNLNSVIVKNVDRIWIFDENKMIFNGNIHDVFTYFNQYHPNRFETETICSHCNSINPESISQIINQKEIDENGNLKSQRKISSYEWYALFKNNIENKLEFINAKKILPFHVSKIPKIHKQYFIYLRRFFSITRKKYNTYCKDLLLFSFLEVIIAFLFRNEWGPLYKYGLNPSIHVYFAITVLFLFVIGFILAEKEIKQYNKFNTLDGNINLSYISRINAEYTHLFTLSFIYSLIFALIGLSILKIGGYFYKYFTVYLSISCLGNITAILLNLIFKKRFNIFISFLILTSFFTLFNGNTINLSNYPNSLKAEKYTPLIADLSPMRWAFEALIVDQTINNNYEKNFYDLDKKIEISAYNANYFIPEIQKKLMQIHSDISNFHNKKLLAVIKKEIEDFHKKDPEIFPFEYLNDLTPEKINSDLINETIDYLRYAQIYFSEQIGVTTEKKHNLENQLTNKYGKNKISEIKLKNFNIHMFELMNSFRNNEGVKFYEGSIIKLFNPIYISPESNYGRAPLFVAEKLFNGYYYDTYWFNLFIIWMFALFFYIITISNSYKF